jgi:hypothetical protein
MSELKGQDLLALKCARLAKELKRRRDREMSCQEIRHEIIGLRDSLANAHVPKWSLTLHKRAAGDIVSGVPCLCVSDWHWGEEVFAEQVEHRNRFNMEVAHERVRRLVLGTDSLLHRFIHNKYPGLVVAFGGDMLSGDIHADLVETNVLPTPAAFADLYGTMIWFLETLADKFGNVYAPCVHGNHTRITEKPRAKLAAYRTWDWLLYTMLAKHFEKDSRIAFNISDAEDVRWTMCGTRFLMTHGSQFRGGSGVQGALAPWMIGDYRKRKREQSWRGGGYDYLVLAHWHQVFHGKGLIVNGSLKGYDEYAYAHNYEYEVPKQALFICHPEKGIPFWMPVMLEDLPKRRVASQVAWLK